MPGVTLLGHSSPSAQVSIWATCEEKLYKYSDAHALLCLE